ncbi:MAG: hypothetical protein M3040_08060 [Bacteroidota bacterium]|nr:hypothetical protein [Bacteroidota bacterium]
MQAALFIFYLLIFSFFIITIPFFKKSGIGKTPLIALFIVKILAGIGYGKFYTLPKYYANSDTWRFYRLSLEETKMLRQSPLLFSQDLFHYGYSSSGNIFSGENTYWNDLKSNLPVKIMAVFNVLTDNSYYTNIILFNFLFMFGLVALFKVFNTICLGKRWVIIGSIFLLPSTLFWCSGIHKDGLILSAIGLTIYCLFTLINKGVAIKHILLIIFSFVLIFALRNYILFTLLPALVCWVVSEKYPKQKRAIFITAYTVAVMCFFMLPLIFPAVNLPLYIVGKQQEFLQLSAGSHVAAAPLIPSFTGFISYLPHAVDMAFFRPHITKALNLSYLPAIIENVLLITLILISAFRFNKHTPLPPVVLCLLSFSMSVLLICGYTVPFTGAIVRYRSLVLPLLLTPLLCSANFSFPKRKHSILSADNF